MMKNILVLQHVPHEGLGTIEPLLSNHSIHFTIKNLLQEKLTPDDFEKDVLIIMGGPMGVYDTKKYPGLVQEHRLIEHYSVQNKGLLGICLGAQLIAEVLGGKVYKNKEKEIGWYPLNVTQNGKLDPIFQSFNQEEVVFQWHGDTFELPKGAIHLASSPLCAHQAFRYGDKIYGLQFHLEVDFPMIKSWLSEPMNQEELNHLQNKISPEKILKDTSHYLPRLLELVKFALQFYFLEFL